MAQAFVNGGDQFRCSVCLEALKEPVTIPCGHSYCMSCIGGCWDQEEKRGEFSCPQCREKFIPRPALKKNTMLAELVEKMKICGGQTGPAATPNAEGEVPCDFCSDEKLKAVKSCLVCQVSLCDTHLQPHNDIPALKKHKLVKAMQLEEVICSQHGSLLQVFCRTDQKCICILCTMDDHKGHDTVSAAAERKRNEWQLEDMHMKFEERIQEREKKLKDVREAVKSRNSLAEKAEQHSEKVFTRLLESIERRRVEVREQIRGQQKVAVSHAERVVEELEEEVAELRRGDAELEQLPRNDNNVHFLQIFHGLETSLDCTGLPSMTLSSESSFKGLQRSLSAFEKGVGNVSERDMKWINKKLKNIKVVRPPVPKTRQDFLKYSCQLTLDPNTANSSISLSEDNRKATHHLQEQQYPDHPDRFKSTRQVLCKEGLTGRCYWEVELSPEGNFSADIAVAYKGIKREESDGDAKEDEEMEEEEDNFEMDDDMKEVDGGDDASPDDIGDGNGARRGRYSIEDDDYYDDDDDYYYDDDDDYYVDDDDDDDDDDDFNYTDPTVLSADSDDSDDGEDDYVCRVLSAFGRNEQSWSFQIAYDLLDETSGCFYHNGKRSKDVSVPSSKIGVYLDHRQGILSFYNVCYGMTLLHTEHTTFTEPLYPGFGLYEECSVTLCM
ncbi:tripartite motif-containing protein 16-like [Engraulis encrasicolus]|uniref:tripartite motif-containing protein 16-like n=1 Tax=Engraulis encrasicolus TaxID=184585 RepID=UPI002FD45836